VIKLDTSQDETAIGFDKTKRGLSNVLGGDIVDGSMQVAGGVVDTGLGLVGEGVSFVGGLFS
jgi:hypothetical protein